MTKWEVAVVFRADSTTSTVVLSTYRNLRDASTEVRNLLEVLEASRFSGPHVKQACDDFLENYISQATRKEDGTGLDITVEQINDFIVRRSTP